MNIKVVFCLLISLLDLASTGQNQHKNPPGFPDRSPDLDVLPGFRNPPKGYGEVSFYWWIGDTLTKERITSQLEQLKDKNITGLQINYCHTDKGGATYGLTYPSQPALFSPEWWELFEWFLKEAKKRDMSVSLSDYTLGAAGQGWYVDEMLNENPHLHGSKLEFKQWDVSGEQLFKTKVPDDVVSVFAYPVRDGFPDGNEPQKLNSGLKNSELVWKVPPGNWKIILVYRNTVKTSFDPMNPLSGAKVIEKFFQRFEDHSPGESGKGLNFFFSDELQFGIRGFLWNDAFPSEFKKRKGYDIVPELPHLFVNLSPRSAKIRLDCNDVMVNLSETGFFKPVYEWHTSRGMLYGCDHGGRGRDVTEFGDYFRTQRWMSGPGCDQPGLGRDIIKNKVASSIAHLYERPRTWLEGFYGSGWGTSPAEVADATFANFAMGHNLLSLHGLYYTTHGSWWEWAAPDNHFRQPYWSHMGDFLKCSERLSYLLSQGHHRCDVAVIYPVAPVEADLKGKEAVNTAFSIARELYPAGIDFDFMDFESLNRCRIENKDLNVSGEKYKVLILPALAAVRYSTMVKALEFFRSGGIVLAVGALPEASDRMGGNDEKLQNIVREMFGTTFSEKHDTLQIYSRKSKSGGTGIFFHNPLDVNKIIHSLIQSDFEVLSGNLTPNIQHRRVGERDIYFVYGLPKGTECFFRCSGKVELWNPWDGTFSSLKVSSVSKDGTVIRLPLEKNEPQLIVFSNGLPEMEEPGNALAGKPDTLILGKTWEFELKPTLDNKYGDYRYPVFNSKLGMEVWKMKFDGATSESAELSKPGYDDSGWQTVEVSYGPQFLRLGPFPGETDLSLLDEKLKALKPADAKLPIEFNGKKYFWQPYEFSWRWGLKDDAGHQGYHGLKGQVNNDLISFGTIDKSRRHMPVYPLLAEPGGAVYYLRSAVISPVKQRVKIKKGGLLPVSVWVNQSTIESEEQDVELLAGANPVLLKYKSTGRGYFVFEQKPVNKEYKKPVPLATDWYLNPSILPFNSDPDQKEKLGWYRFMAPPGAKTMHIPAFSKPEVWVSGEKAVCQKKESEPVHIADPKLPAWCVTFPESIKESVCVAVRLEQTPGLSGGAAIPEPVWFETGNGIIQMGDLGENESLKSYSGGIWYRQTISLSADQANAKQVTLDLGQVVASAEALINGKPAGVRLASPWKFDLTGKLKSGENRIEILVYNTLGNHYVNTPSQYIGRTTSGLIGPVTIYFQ